MQTDGGQLLPGLQKEKHMYDTFQDALQVIYKLDDRYSLYLHLEH